MGLNVVRPRAALSGRKPGFFGTGDRGRRAQGALPPATMVQAVGLTPATAEGGHREVQNRSRGVISTGSTHSVVKSHFSFALSPRVERSATPAGNLCSDLSAAKRHLRPEGALSLAPRRGKPIVAQGRAPWVGGRRRRCFPFPVLRRPRRRKTGKENKRERTCHRGRRSRRPRPRLRWGCPFGAANYLKTVLTAAAEPKTT